VADTLKNIQQNVRGKRQYIARAANALLELADGDAEKLKDVSWENMQFLPAWCLLNKEELVKLQIACGAVYLQPLVKSSVDGAVLKKFKETVGEPLFNFLFELNDTESSEEISTVVLTSDDALPDTIESVGASVLLGTLSDLTVVKLFLPASCSIRACYVGKQQ